MRGFKSGDWVVAVVCGSVLVTGCGLQEQQEGQPDNEPSEQRDESPETSAPEEGEETTPAGGAAWGVPDGLDGWEMSVRDQQGMHQLQQTEGQCQVTMSQNLGVTDAESEGLQPIDSVDSYLDETAQRTEDLSAEPTDPVEVTSATDDTSVEFDAKEATYQGGDGAAYTQQVAAQWFGDVEMLIVLACPSDEWEAQQSALDDLLDATEVHGL